ncbi:g_PROTEIN_RECEP_F1_2 domain-containing protein [Trichonephila clavipes]|nr:g_PROTEIN_RECEP_F1_2 domain-containing protein [Trichonephila clavipes]
MHPTIKNHPFFRIADICTALNFILDPIVYVLSRRPHRRGLRRLLKPICHQCWTQPDISCTGSSSQGTKGKELCLLPKLHESHPNKLTSPASTLQRGVGTSGSERCHLHEDQVQDAFDRPVIEKTATSSDDKRVHVWRPCGERLNPVFALQRHATPTAGVMILLGLTRKGCHKICLRTVSTRPWLARSVDLSPIEHIWDHLGLRVGHPTSLNELEGRPSPKAYSQQPIGIFNSNLRSIPTLESPHWSLPPEATPPSTNQADNTSHITVIDRDRRNVSTVQSLLD